MRKVEMGRTLGQSDIFHFLTTDNNELAGGGFHQSLRSTSARYSITALKVDEAVVMCNFLLLAFLLMNAMCVVHARLYVCAYLSVSP